MDILGDIDKMGSNLDIGGILGVNFLKCLSTKAEIFSVTDPILLTIGQPGLLGFCILGEK